MAYGFVYIVFTYLKIATVNDCAIYNSLLKASQMQTYSYIHLFQLLFTAEFNVAFLYLLSITLSIYLVKMYFKTQHENKVLKMQILKLESTLKVQELQKKQKHTLSSECTIKVLAAQTAKIKEQLQTIRLTVYSLNAK